MCIISGLIVQAALFFGIGWKFGSAYADRRWSRMAERNDADDYMDFAPHPLDPHP